MLCCNERSLMFFTHVTENILRWIPMGAIKMFSFKSIIERKVYWITVMVSLQTRQTLVDCLQGQASTLLDKYKDWGALSLSLLCHSSRGLTPRLDNRRRKRQPLEHTSCLEKTETANRHNGPYLKFGSQEPGDGDKTFNHRVFKFISILLYVSWRMTLSGNSIEKPFTDKNNQIATCQEHFLHPKVTTRINRCLGCERSLAAKVKGG